MKFSHTFLTFTFFSSFANFAPLEAGKNGEELYEMLGEIFLPEAERDFVSLKKKIKMETYLKSRTFFEGISEEDALDFKNALLGLIEVLAPKRGSISQNSKLLSAFAKATRKTKSSYSQIAEELAEFLRPHLSPETQWNEDFILGYLKLRQTLSPEMVQKLVPASNYESDSPSNFTYPKSEEVRKLAKIAVLLKPDEINYALKTLVPDSPLSATTTHLKEMTAFVGRNATLNPKVIAQRFAIADKVNIVKLDSIPALCSHLLTFENLEESAFIFDLHGVLTVKGTPQPQQTDVPARGFIVELLQDLHGTGAKLILSSAWNSFSDILEQLKNLNLEDVFQFSKADICENELDYPIEMHILETGGRLQFRRVGNVVSTKWEEQGHFWKEKIFAPDILGLALQRVTLIDDSMDNIQKAAIQAAESQTGLHTQRIDIIHIKTLKITEPSPSLEAFSRSCDKENNISEEDLTEWENKLKIKKTNLRNFPKRLKKLEKKETKRLYHEEERKKKEEVTHKRKSSLKVARQDWKKSPQLPRASSPLSLSPRASGASSDDDNERSPKSPRKLGETENSFSLHSPSSSMGSLSPRSPRVDELAKSKDDQSSLSSGDEGYCDKELFDLLCQESPRGNSEAENL